MWLNMAENCLKELILFHIFLAIVQKSTRYDANQHIRCLPTLHIFLTAKQLQKSTTTQQDIENCRKKTVLAHSFWRESKKRQCNTFLCQQDNARYGDQFSYSIKCVFCCCNGVPLFLTSFVRTKMPRKKAQNKIIPSIYSFQNIQLDLVLLQWSCIVLPYLRVHLRHRQVSKCKAIRIQHKTRMLSYVDAISNLSCFSVVSQVVALFPMVCVFLYHRNAKIDRLQ